MSKYTTEVRFICETEAGLSDSVGYNDVDTVISSARSKIFDFSYPIWDNAYKSVLETKILRHYYTREIGFETVGLWKLKMATKLQEIMPYYNKLYETTVLNFNPLYDVNLVTEHKGKGTNTGTDVLNNSGGVTKTTTGGYEDTPNKTVTTTYNTTDTGSLSGSDVTSTDGTNTKRDRYSDTPQGALTGIENDNYLTNARKITEEMDTDVTTTYGRTDTNNKTGSEATTESGSTSRTYQNLKDTTVNDETQTKTLDLANTDEYIHTVIGKSAGTSYSKLIDDFRKTIINIDLRIINELADLFFGLW